MPAVASNTGCYHFELLYVLVFLLGCPKGQKFTTVILKKETLKINID